jgi:hypothetical protein
MILEVCWDGLWTLSFGLSQFHGHGSWLVCEVVLRSPSREEKGGGPYTHLTNFHQVNFASHADPLPKSVATVLRGQIPHVFQSGPTHDVVFCLYFFIISSHTDELSVTMQCIIAPSLIQLIMCPNLSSLPLSQLTIVQGK